MKATVTIEAGDMIGKLDDLIDRMKGALLDLGTIMAGKIEAAARTNAIWTDRTTNARTGLTALAVLEGGKLIIYLFHIQTYGLWLEVAMGQKYAIIMKTLQEYYPQVMAMAGRLLTGG